MKEVQWIDPDFLAPKDAWDRLSMKEKAAMMKVAVQNGITNLSDIRAKYNEFAEGGDLEGSIVKDNVGYSEWVNSLPDNLKHTDPALYDMLGAYKAGMQPTLEKDGLYHLQSRDPRTGRILKSPIYPTYLQAIATDTSLGYFPIVDDKGNTYTKTWEGNTLFQPEDNEYRGPIVEEANVNANGGNLFRGGGSIVSDRLVDMTIEEEGFNKQPEDIGDGKMTLGSGLTASKWHDLYRKRGNKWSAADNRMAVRQELSDRERWARSNVPNWDNLPDSSKEALLMYKYNYDFNRANSPKLFAALEAGNLPEAARQMDATSKIPKFKKGLTNRRKREQAHFMLGVRPTPTAPSDITLQSPDNTFVYNPYLLQEQNTTMLPQVVPDKDAYVSTHEVSPEEIKAQKLQESFDNINRFNRTMEMLGNNLRIPTFHPTTGNDVLDLLWATRGNDSPLLQMADEYARGGRIHIKEKNRGKFTRLKERTGKSASWFKAHGTPAQKKMAIFALNARKWKHGLGGNLFEMGGPTQDNDPATKDWEHRREHEEVKPQYKRTEKDEEYWQEKNRRNAEAAEKLNRQKDVVMSELEQQANSTPFTGEAYKSAVDEQRQKVLGKAKDYEKGAKSVITAAELGLSGASLLGAYANWRNWANAANLTKKGIANLLQKAQAPMQEAGTLIDAYQTMDAAGNNDFDTYYNGASGLLGVAGTIGASDVFRGRHPYVDRALDALGIIQNTGDYLKFGYDTFFGSPDNKKSLGGNLFSGEENHSSQMNIGLNATNGWQPYTLGDIVANGERVTRQRKALQDTFLTFPVESNDATAVANGRPQNTHLEGKAVRGGAANAAWEKEHPGLAQLGYAASAVPFAVASAPLLGATAETGAGQAVTTGLGWLGDAAVSSPLFTNAASRALGTSTLLPWLDAGMTAGFGAHGIQETAEGNFTPMTVLEVAPLGRLAKPITKEAALAVENYRYPLGRPIIPKGYNPTYDDYNYFHGGLDADFDFNTLDVYRRGSKQAKKGRDYAGFYMTNSMQKPQAFGYGAGEAHGIKVADDAKILKLDNNIERISSDELKGYRSQGYDLVTGPNVFKQPEYILLNKDVIQGTHFFPEAPQNEIFLRKAPKDVFEIKKNKYPTVNWQEVVTPQITAENAASVQRQMGDAAISGTAESTAKAVENGRNSLLDWIKSPFYRARLKEEPLYRVADDVVADAEQMLKNAPIHLKDRMQLSNDGIVNGITTTRPAIAEKTFPDGTKVINLNTGLDVDIAADLGENADKTTLHELLHYMTANSKGSPIPSNAGERIINKGWMEPTETHFDAINIMHKNRSKGWQNYILDQNDALLPKYDEVVKMVMEKPEEAKAALIRAGRAPADADAAIQSLRNRYSVWHDIQEQRAYLQELFLSKIKPNLKNPNDAAEIEAFMSEHPEILDGSPAYKYIQEVRPGTLKQYAGYFASALSTLPFINKMTKE